MTLSPGATVQPIGRARSLTVRQSCSALRESPASGTPAPTVLECVRCCADFIRSCGSPPWPSRTPCRPLRRPLPITPRLFGEALLARQWGRIGTEGRVRLDAYPDEGAARNALAALARAKLRRGYRASRSV